MLQRQLPLLLAVVLWALSPQSAMGVDCNGNGISDETDISSGTSQDCNSNGTPDECDLITLYVGTQGGTGIGRVYKYLGENDLQDPANNWVDLTPSPAWNVSAVMDLVIFQGKLYAGVQTVHGRGGGSNGEGHIWRLDSTGWVRITATPLDRSVMVLEVLEGRIRCQEP